MGEKFRERVPDEHVHPTCPRMCRSMFKRSEMKGFPLEKINKALGDTTVSCPMYPNIVDNMLCNLLEI